MLFDLGALNERSFRLEIGPYKIAERFAEPYYVNLTPKNPDGYIVRPVPTGYGVFAENDELIEEFDSWAEARYFIFAKTI